MKRLTARPVSYVSLDYVEINELAKKVYGFPSGKLAHTVFELEDTQSGMSFSVTVNRGVRPYERADFESWLQLQSGHYEPCVSMDTILSDLCEKGYLDPGDYTVDIDY